MQRVDPWSEDYEAELRLRDARSRVWAAWLFVAAIAVAIFFALLLLVAIVGVIALDGMFDWFNID